MEAEDILTALSTRLLILYFIYYFFFLNLHMEHFSYGLDAFRTYVPSQSSFPLKFAQFLMIMTALHY